MSSPASVFHHLMSLLGMVIWQDVAAPILPVPPEGTNFPAPASAAQLRPTVSSAADLRTRLTDSWHWMVTSRVQSVASVSASAWTGYLSLPFAPQVSLSSVQSFWVYGFVRPLEHLLLCCVVFLFPLSLLFKFEYVPPAPSCILLIGSLLACSWQLSMYRQTDQTQREGGNAHHVTSTAIIHKHKVNSFTF